MQRGHLLAFHPKLSTQQLLRADSRLTVPKLLSRGRAMQRRVAILGWAGLGGLCGALLLYGLGAAQAPQTQPPSGKTYFPVVEQDFAKVRADDQAAKPAVMQRQEALLAERYDADFDLPDHLLPEFPPPVFLSTRPELGDVSRGQLLTIRNYFAILDGILTPVQMEGMRLLLTPFPQQQFNQTDDRKTDVQSLGIACLDCHSNGHTNAAFHQNPDNRPQAAGRALLQAAHDQRSVEPRRGPHQDLHPARDQGLPAVPARRAPLDAGGYGGVF